MSVRNYSEMGENLYKIISRLMANDNLVKLLYYTDHDPLSHPALTEEEKREKVFSKLIKFIPLIGPKETDNSIIVLRVASAKNIQWNQEFQNITISIEIFVPITQWVIKNENLRPFLIMGEIQKSLANKTINGMGKILGGDFTLNFLTEEISCYEQIFTIQTYD